MESASFREAESNIVDLMRYQKVTRTQINVIIDAVISNGQINCANGTTEHIIKLVRGHKNLIDKQTLSRLDQVMRKLNKRAWKPVKVLFTGLHCANTWPHD